MCGPCHCAGSTAAGPLPFRPGPGAPSRGGHVVHGQSRLQRHQNMGLHFQRIVQCAHQRPERFLVLALVKIFHCLLKGRAAGPPPGCRSGRSADACGCPPGAAGCRHLLFLPSVHHSSSFCNLFQYNRFCAISQSTVETLSVKPYGFASSPEGQVLNFSLHLDFFALKRI